MQKRTIAKARETLSDIINGVAYGNERYILKKHNKDVVAVISLEDLAILESMEDSIDLQLAKKAMKENKWTSWEVIKKKIGKHVRDSIRGAR